ncbi:hypothetical protein B0I72DRAFT_13039 [Yarrowia lipolytica]|nr:hypothetical protein BKA91DRAFT_44679 [Yarrowia lipolytica]KAE8172808.1 hypothetical protein BKA90DRAFT_14832 [Yarrowia lipolytica]RDW30198.1 hypothetical protein B0I72DRAFT_13039 [Yarrowia lipolytica]RDW41235.1 hypothetical protein B0I73DRAFT_10447 [Yarrowia lipolytica]RMI93918.1 hypothetical protein BD777DRAFT_33112 [Yarrowia lipolytica]
MFGLVFSFFIFSLSSFHFPSFHFPPFPFFLFLFFFSLFSFPFFFSFSFVGIIQINSHSSNLIKKHQRNQKKLPKVQSNLTTIPVSGASGSIV